MILISPGIFMIFQHRTYSQILSAINFTLCNLLLLKCAFFIAFLCKKNRRATKEPKHRFRLITWPYYVREHPEQKCRQVLKRVISINTRLASSLTRIKLTSSSLKPSLFLKTSWQNRSLISCKRSIPRPGYSGPDWHHLSGVSEFIRQIIS